MTRLAILALAAVLAHSLTEPLPPAVAPTVPPARAHHAMGYDESSHRVLMTGGSTPVDGGQNSTFFSDVWSYDGSRWRPITVSRGVAMSGMQLAYDTRHHRIVSFGGYDGSARADLRVLRAGSWQTLGEHKEMPVAEPGFVYDRRRDRFVAFGGSAASGTAYADTWIYSHDRWQKLDVTGPPGRQGHVMVHHERRGRIVVFGGMGSAPPGRQPPILDDLWELDGDRWKQLAVPGPSGRSGAGATYDSRRGLIIIFGGLEAAGFARDTWAFDGWRWRKLSEEGPEPRGMGYLAYDKRRDRVVMFGGRKGWPNGDLNDTWEWDGARWRRVDM